MNTQKPYLCLFAQRDIQTGEELLYDYSVSDLPWKEKKANESMSTADSEEPGSLTHDRREPSEEPASLTHDRREPSEEPASLTHESMSTADSEEPGSLTHDRREPSEEPASLTHDRREPSEEPASLTHESMSTADSEEPGSVTHDRREPSEEPASLSHDRKEPNPQGTGTRKGMKRKWASEENICFMNFFRDELREKKMPSGSKIMGSLKILTGRTVAQIRARVHNIIMEKQKWKKNC
ncbi:hepatoma-derived growth factor-related protein 2-like isoform X5 [Dreissena polymorpha]|uniref:hepatoma-derived growth factor-related protein 2-like isoform X5 n=1 Tax=Dreissena polymorpha TaxID=45954 RepID=UPI002264AD1B|nr:hepatoma-derived growth factor-related protein 2-like isoform X5 [Dreissena polymorpha]